MLADVFNRKTGRRGRVYVCNGCRGRTRVLKADAPLPSDWSEKTEDRYTDDGTRCRKLGLVVNYYCSLCTHDGLNAWVVGRVLRGRTGKGQKIV